MDVRVDALLTGRVKRFADGMRSAIDKTPRLGPVAFGPLGLDGDAVADKRYHGGIDIAVHHFPFDHYAHFAPLAPAGAPIVHPGSFGENVSTFGTDEHGVCIGDRWRLGNVLLEVSQGRVPCSKLARRMGWPLLPKLVTRDRRCGWYYRVVESGTAQAGDRVTLVERVAPDWTVARVFALVIAGDGKRAPDELRAMLSGAARLCDEWRARAQTMLDTASR